MEMRHALQKASALACLATSLVLPQPSEATEYGFSEYFLGLTIPMAGYVPPPGAYFEDTFLLYQGPSPALNAHLVINIAQAGYFFETGLFGATFGLCCDYSLSRGPKFDPCLIYRFVRDEVAFPQNRGYREPRRHRLQRRPWLAFGRP